uniref:Golgin subfamily A conserved domain-containing protein n=1 Tax=Rhinopithecus roxellana TaxID=61622 RepID=A0A2K6P373_RHIRO
MRGCGRRRGCQSRRGCWSRWRSYWNRRGGRRNRRGCWTRGGCWSRWRSFWNRRGDRRSRRGCWRRSSCWTKWRSCWNRRGCGSRIRGCGSRRHCCGSWRGCCSWGGKPSTSRRLSHTAASRTWWNNENKSTLQLEQQVKELKLGAPGSYEPAETAAKAQLSLIALPGEGDGGGHLDSEEEEAPRPMLNIPGDLESLEVAFFNDAGASAQEEQRVCCQPLAHPVASSQRTPGTGGESVCGETHRALQGAVEKVQLSRTKWT